MRWLLASGRSGLNYKRTEAVVIFLVASLATASDALGRTRTPCIHHLCLRGGSAVAVGAPVDDVGAPGYGGVFGGDLRPLGVSKARQTLAMVVPGTHDNMTHAIASAGDYQQSILACSGDHRWIDVLSTAPTLNGSIDVKGAAKTRLLGMWQLYSAPDLETSSHGSFVNVTCAYATDDYGKVADTPHALFAIMGGPWNFVKCELRAAAADVLACYSVASIDVEACGIGGMGSYDTNNGSMLAVGGVHCADVGAVSLRS
jgi:hypothetical protein